MAKKPEHKRISEEADNDPEPLLTTSSTPLTANFEAAHAESPLLPPSSGDFHATFPIKASGEIGVVIGDVSGHGPAAAVQAEQIKEAISDELNNGASPAEALAAVNSAVEADTGFDGFATAIAGRIDAKTGKLRYANGGHEPGLLAAGGEQTQPEHLKELATTGPPVGVLPAQTAHYSEKVATIPEGGTLLLYTDGVSEARSPHARDWLGVHRLKTFFASLANLPPTRLVSGILARVLAFSGRVMRDDFVLLAVRRRLGRNSIKRSAPRTASK